MSNPALATVDPVDGTLYLIYEDNSVWAYRPPSKERLQEGWRKVKGGGGTSDPSTFEVTDTSTSRLPQSVGQKLVRR